MTYLIGGIDPIAGPTVVMRCPACGQGGTFEPMQNVHDVRPADDPTILLGQRKCPNTKCRAHVFVVLRNFDLHKSYPPLRIDFEPTGIPERIVNTITEALTCHAEGLYVAGAIMVRRTLEELCEDKKASGKDLKDRIEALGASIIIPKGLLEAMDDLRLLGNDAAHIQAKTYDEIGKDELDAAIDVTKEILKAVYQYGALVDRLKALKKVKATPEPGS